MTSMLRDVSTTGAYPINLDALKSAIRAVVITDKASTGPIAARYAWHASGTYDKNDKTGGCNGATIRFKPESDDPANAGLSIIRDLLHPIKQARPEISNADLIAYAGVCAIEFLGGPVIPFNFGRTDDNNNARCPANGRLPDALQGADHLRCVFGRMGFNDQEIVALSGGHTLGRGHRVRSGFDGPWTTHPLRFDNEYFVNLIERKWKKREWDGKDQFVDEESGKLMMLPTDIALINDANMRKYVVAYAKDQALFFHDFAEAYGKLLALGCPPCCQPHYKPPPPTERQKLSAEFRELAMHGSVEPAQAIADKCDVHELEATSGRSALHKAAFWAHEQMVSYLIGLKLDLNIQDRDGDTALHDAAKFGHVTVVKLLLQAGIDATLKNKSGKTALQVAIYHEKDEVVSLLKQHAKL